MSIYIRVQREHDSRTDPVCLYSELDADRWETRKVEAFRDGSYGYASKKEARGPTRLGVEPIPSLGEIARDDQFKPAEITRDEFDEIWAKAFF
jgi:hypothetical protein